MRRKFSLVFLLLYATLLLGYEVMPIKIENDMVVFRVKADKAEKVSVAGDFNGWNKDKDFLVKGDNNIWSIKLTIMPGKYNYKFIFDDQWMGGANLKLDIYENKYGYLVLKRPEIDLPMLSNKVAIHGKYVFRLTGAVENSINYVTNNASGIYVTNTEFNLRTPNHYIEFGLEMNITEKIYGYALLNIFTGNTNYKEALNYLRGELNLDLNYLNVKGFINTRVMNFNDPMHLFYNQGRTLYDPIYFYKKDAPDIRYLKFGRKTAGFSLEADIKGISLKALYADYMYHGTDKFGFRLYNKDILDKYLTIGLNFFSYKDPEYTEILSVGWHEYPTGSGIWYRFDKLNLLPSINVGGDIFSDAIPYTEIFAQYNFGRTGSYTAHADMANGTEDGTGVDHPVDYDFQGNFFENSHKVLFGVYGKFKEHILAGAEYRFSNNTSFTSIYRVKKESILSHNIVGRGRFKLELGKRSEISLGAEYSLLFNSEAYNMSIQKLGLLYTTRILDQLFDLTLPVKSLHNIEARVLFRLKKPIFLNFLYATRINVLNYDTSTKLFHMIHLARIEISEFFNNFSIIGELAFDYYSDDYKLFSNDYTSSEYFTTGTNVSSSYKVSDRANYNIKKVLWRIIPFVALKYNYTKDIYIQISYGIDPLNFEGEVFGRDDVMKEKFEFTYNSSSETLGSSPTAERAFNALCTAIDMLYSDRIITIEGSVRF